MGIRSILSLLLITAPIVATTVACGGEDATASSEDDELNQRTYVYVDTNPEAPLSSMARGKIQAALGKLDRVARRAESPLRRALAAETLARVEAGQVMLGSIAGARGIDRWHMCKDYSLDACKGAPPSADDRTWQGDAEVQRVLDRDLAGYMWGNRLYFTLHQSTDVTELAGTLIHEINHVANRSECHYYKNIATHEVEPDDAFVEEYRAFFTECYFTRDTSASPEACDAYASDRAGSYGFASDLARILKNSASKQSVQLAKAIVASEDVPNTTAGAGGVAAVAAATTPSATAKFGRLIPHAEMWPSSFGACPSSR